MKYNLSEMETELAEIIWEREPIKSSELVDICAKKFDWKKSTTYTMIKRVENKGVIINEDGIVKSTISRKDFYASLSSNYVKKSFDGSLPKFIAAFTRAEKLSDADIKEIETMIREHREEK
ncbi:CopY family transcriptional repressor [Keratinibaculum paraultunense]|uniref:CopY family transcriptional repressor n=1 Tax=Keratinibaculum paraultunense TaxID=1278232 RepID=A0A4R3L1Y6_9FIRM|nr:BlaI/MecI/CopY family transcriptional regulator [Keratinibaculum paraultunense]QQY80492.1 BlaI/MecI/CopY family transcriptional regulator [Keratinibaculum paraultunense]TCS91211.1 CopY family transcriptional repressor [Keratinibaculum paraultunense]